MLHMIPQGQNLSSVVKCPRGAPGPMDSELLVDHNQVKARLFLDRENNCDRIRVLQSPCGIIQTSLRPDFTSADL
jgi:hypothetical protein